MIKPFSSLLIKYICIVKKRGGGLKHMIASSTNTEERVLYEYSHKSHCVFLVLWEQGSITVTDRIYWKPFPGPNSASFRTSNQCSLSDVMSWFRVRPIPRKDTLRFTCVAVTINCSTTDAHQNPKFSDVQTPKPESLHERIVLFIDWWNWLMKSTFGTD